MKTLFFIICKIKGYIFDKNKSRISKLVFYLSSSGKICIEYSKNNTVKKMLYNLQLDFVGFTNNDVVDCGYNKSPLEFYSRTKPDVFKKQITVLKTAWSDLDKDQFIEYICSSSLEKNVWINRKHLKRVHSVKLKIPQITMNDLISAISQTRIIVNKNLTIDEINNILNTIKYPSIEIDWIPLIKNKCNIRSTGLKKYVLYYVSECPKLTEI